MEFEGRALGETEMGYVDRNLVPGETLLYRTRHHWLVLLGPLIAGSSLLVPGVGEGVAGVQFISGVLESSRQNSAWVKLS